MSTLETGKKTTVRIQPLAIYEYTDLDNIPRLITDLQDALPTFKNAIRPPCVGSNHLKLVDKKWVYQFVRQKGKALQKDKAVMKAEAYITVAQGRQTSQQSDWSLGTQNSPDDERPLDASDDSVFSIDLAEPCWLILSENQIPEYRLNWYRGNPNTLNDRAQFIDPQEIPSNANSTSPLSVYLVDPITIAQSLSNDYRNALINFGSWHKGDLDASGQKYANEEAKNNDVNSVQYHRMFYGMIHSIANAEPQIKDWLNWDKLKADADKIEAFESHYLDACRKAEDRLLLWKQSNFFRNSWLDRSGTEQNDKSAFNILPEITACTEHRYLVWELNQPDSWYNAVFSDQKMRGNAFQFCRKTATIILDEHLAEFVEHWIIGKSLAAISSSGLARNKRQNTLESLISEIETTIIRKRWHEHLGEFTVNGKKTSNLNPNRTISGNHQSQHFLRKLEDLNGVTIGHYFSDYHESTSALTTGDINTFLEQQKNKISDLKQLKPIAKRIFLGIETFNLIAARNQLIEAQEGSTSQEILSAQINTIGSMGSLCGSMEFLAKELFPKFWKSFGPIALIVDSGADLWEAYQGLRDPSAIANPGLIMGNLLVSVSAIGGMALGLYALTSSGVAAAIFSPVSLVLVAAVIAGKVLIFLFSKSEIETWCRRSRFSKLKFYQKEQPGIRYQPIQVGQSIPLSNYTDYQPDSSGIKGELKGLVDTLSLLRPRCYIKPIQGKLHTGPDGDYFDYTYRVVVEIGLGPIFNLKTSKIHFDLDVFVDRTFSLKPIGSKHGVLLHPEERLEISAEKHEFPKPDFTQLTKNAETDQNYSNAENEVFSSKLVIENGAALSWEKEFPVEQLGITKYVFRRKLDFKISNLYLMLNGDNSPDNCHPNKNGISISGDLELTEQPYLPKQNRHNSK